MALFHVYDIYDGHGEKELTTYGFTAEEQEEIKAVLAGAPLLTALAARVRAEPKVAKYMEERRSKEWTM